MHLLYLTADPGVPVLGHKGASVHVRELAGALALAGARVTIASPSIEPVGDVPPDGVRLVGIPPVRPGGHVSETTLEAAMLAQRQFIVELGRRLAVDAVYERYSLFSDAGICLARACGLPHVLELNAPLRHEAERFRTLPHPGVAAAVERRVFASSDRILVVSDALRRLIRGSGVPAGKVEVVPNGVSAAKTAPRRTPPGDRFVAGFAGSLKPWHGIETLVTAAHKAFAAEPRLRLEVIGTGPMEHLLADLDPARTLAHGALAHTATLEAMRGWDAGLAPYSALPDFYFSPLKVREYMAIGLCPVASSLGELPALLGEGDLGVLVPPDDPDALASVLVDLARDPERARRLGAAARDHVLAGKGWAANAARVLVALERAGARAAA